VGDQRDAQGRSALQLAYQRAGESYEAITEFRAKLLTLLPLATGTGVFLLLERAQAQNSAQFKGFLGPIGLFSAVVTLGLFTYELRGMQRCHRLEVQAAVLEKQLGLSTEQGPFRGQPPRALGNMLGPPAAGLIIYLATLFAWLGLAGYGFCWKRGFGWWGVLSAYVVVLIAAWVVLSRWLQRSATVGLPKKLKKRRVEMPPIDPTYSSDSRLIAAKEKTVELIAANKKVKDLAGKQALAAQLDGAEKEYLYRLYQALLQCRIPVAVQNRQRSKRWRIRG